MVLNTNQKNKKKMKSLSTIKVIMVLLLAFQFTVSHAQKSYYDYSESKKAIVLDEDFNDNSLGWLERADESSAYDISNGKYGIESKNDQAKLVFKAFNLNPEMDFEIETSIKFEFGKESKPAGLIWGYADDGDHEFFITKNGYYRLVEYYDGDYHYRTEYEPIESINPDGYNQLTIRKVNNTVYFFVNKTFVHSLLHKEFYGNKIGFYTSSSSRISADYIKVSYLNTGDAGDYNKIASKRTTIVNDKFINSDFGWFEENDDDGEDAYIIEKGHYMLKSLTDKSKLTSIRLVELDLSGSFEIEADFKIADGRETGNHAFLFGKDDASDYGFYFSNDGFFKLSAYNQEYVDYTSFGVIPGFKSDAYNKITIRKVDDLLYFFVNENLIYAIAYSDMMFFGTKIAFMVASNSELHVDNFAFRKIN